MSKNVLGSVLKDLKNSTSHSVDYLLSDDVESTLSINGMKIRKLFAPILRMIYKTQTKYKLIKEKDLEDNKKIKGKIFIVNHRQADDIVLGANAIGESGYIVFGNKYLALETTNGLGLWAYGMILLDRDNDLNRKNTYNKMKYVIEHGANIIIYPEGYWNLDDNGLADERHGSDLHNSENWLIQDFNIGAFRLAKETGCAIIPSVLHYDEVDKKRCYSQKGKAFYIGKDDDVFEKKDEILAAMTTMYYNLMEKHSTYERSDLEKDGISLKEQWQQLKKELVADCDIPSIGYKLDLADEKKIGKAKVKNDIVSNEEAFAHIDRLEPSKKNAFLLSKRLTGRK